MKTPRKEAKVKHVLSAKQSRGHICHWPNCIKQVPPAMWGCKEHWFRLPARLRNKIWATYSIGQEDRMDPSAEYLDAADEVQRWAREEMSKQHGDETSPMTMGPETFEDSP